MNMSNRKKRIQPLNHSEFHILLALADEDRHGYGIMREVEERSGGTVRLGPGTLYGAIKRLMSAGMVEESGERPAEEDDQRRRCYYRLTTRGAEAAMEEADRLAALVHVAEEKRILAPKPRLALGGAE